jgi:hypothetical protein
MPFKRNSCDNWSKWLRLFDPISFATSDGMSRVEMNRENFGKSWAMRVNVTSGAGELNANAAARTPIS